MAISVAPLTTTVMNSVPANHAGTASGINNAVSRAAGLLAIAVLGIVMLQTFNRSLDRQLAKIDISESVRHSIDHQRINLAAARIPDDVPPRERERLREGIEQSFVGGFRCVMLVGASLALTSSIVSWLLISGRKSASRS